MFWDASWLDDDNHDKEADMADDGPQVAWTLEVRKKVWALIDNTSTEIGGFGYAALEDDGKSLIWYDVFLVPQEVSGSSVDYEAKGLAYAIDRAGEDGVLAQKDHVWVSWHSHNSMDSFWSPTDEDCIKIYGRGGMPLLLSFVGNHKHEFKARLDFFGVEHRGVKLPTVRMNLDQIKLDGEEPVDPYVEEIKREIKEFVDERWTVGRGRVWEKTSNGGRWRSWWTGKDEDEDQEERSPAATQAATRLSNPRQLALGSGDGDYENNAGEVVRVARSSPPGTDGTWDDPDQAAAEMEGGEA